MALLQTSRNCKNCGRRTLHARHVLGLGWGLLLTIITAGLFIPVWMLIGILGAFQTWKCQSCGTGRLT
jgi:hypothetical protein